MLLRGSTRLLRLPVENFHLFVVCNRAIAKKRLHMRDGYAIILTTVGTERLAEDIAQGLIDAKLAACVQIQMVKSLYEWHGKVERAREYLLTIKSKKCLFAEISEFIAKNHGYQIPEIVQIPIVDGSEGYLDWIDTRAR
jgi:periplasmic divalent cation tolerance protein